MKTLQIVLSILIITCISSCSSVYKKHYDKGFTILQHKKQGSKNITKKSPNLQEQTIIALNKDVKKDKEKEQLKAEKSFQSIHKSIDKIENNAPARLLSSINKFTLNKIEALKPDTVYRKEPAKNNSMDSAVRNKSQNALIFAIVSIVCFWLLWILSLIPAIIALVMAKKAIAMAKLNGDTAPSEANTAKIIAWVTIGLNLLSIFIIVLYIFIVILVLAGI